MKESSGKIEFFYQHNDGSQKVVITLPPDANLDQVLGAFESFLIAAGYRFNGEINIDGNICDPTVEEN